MQILPEFADSSLQLVKSSALHSSLQSEAQQTSFPKYENRLLFGRRFLQKELSICYSADIQK